MKKIVTNIVLGLIIIFGVCIVVLNIIGFKTYRVISDSMAPNIYKNAIAIVKIYDDNITLEENDIIAFNVNDKLVLHRIEEINGEEIITKGDANDSLDSPISIDSVIGVYVFSIPLIGILFASIYPWIIIILSIFCYIIIKQIYKELKKNDGGK